MSKIHPKHRVPGTGIVVDCFSPPRPSWISHRFLSHAHADHYYGLRADYDSVPIFCSQITGRLIEMSIGVNKRFIITLPMRVLVKLDKWGLDEWTVQLLDANHCPGAVMFLFEGKGKRYLHCGDMRFDERLFSSKWSMLCHVDLMYLDTTYCNPKYAFPQQDETVMEAVQAVAEEMKTGRPLVLIPTYTIGKEKILSALSKYLKKRVRVSERKARSLRALQLWHDEIYTDNGDEDSPLVAISWDVVTRSVPWGWNPKYEAMNSLLNAENARTLDKSRMYDRAVALVATGWSFQVKNELFVQRKDHLSVIGVPYSEHSSYTELVRFVELVRPKKIIPTVGNSSTADEKRMLSHFNKYIDTTEAKKAFFSRYNKSSEAGQQKPVTSDSDTAAKLDEGRPTGSFDLTTNNVVKSAEKLDANGSCLRHCTRTTNDGSREEPRQLQEAPKVSRSSNSLDTQKRGPTGKRSKMNESPSEPLKKVAKERRPPKYKQKLISSFFRPK